MLPRRVLVVAPALSVVAAVALTSAVGAYTVGVLGHCDYKLGCWGSVQVAAFFAGAIALLIGVAVAFTSLAGSAFGSSHIRPLATYVVSVALSLLVAGWLTWPMWRA
jgi:hypothetical protein